MTERQIGYIAGFIDGEGWIGITTRRRTWKGTTRQRRYHRPIVAISQVKQGPLEYIASVLGHRDISLKKESGYWCLRLHPPCLKWLLPQLHGAFRLKQRQADILIKFMNECRYQGKELTASQYNARQSLYLQMRQLNIKPNT